jgi:tol-pal system protein YbgF
MNKALLFMTLFAFALPACAQSSSKVLMDMLDRMDRLQAEVQELRGETEKNRHDLDRMKERQQSLYLDLDKRLLDLEGGGAGRASVPPENQKPASPQETPEQRMPAEEPQNAGSWEESAGESEVVSEEEPPKQKAEATDLASEEAIYQEAFVYLNNGRYDDAIADFSRLIQTYPEGEYADNAEYWIGETYYVKRDFDRAREHFNLVMERYPESNKAPDALLKLAYIEYELSQWKSARKILNSLIEQYPASNSAQLAQDRLDRMRKEGR